MERATIDRRRASSPSTPQTGTHLSTRQSDVTSDRHCEDCLFPFEFDGKSIHSGAADSGRRHRSWHENACMLPIGLQAIGANTLRYVRYLDDFPVFPI